MIQINLLSMASTHCLQEKAKQAAQAMQILLALTGPLGAFPGFLHTAPSACGLLRLLSDLNPSNTEFILNNVYKFCLHLTGNTLRLHYKAQPVNAVWGNSRCLL
jgi:hypothetical protein